MSSIICPNCGEFIELWFDEEMSECSCGNRLNFMEIDDEERDRLLNEIKQFRGNSKKVKEFLIKYIMVRR